MTRMPCPRCGNPMNRHAEKLVLPPDTVPPPDAPFPGVIEQLHQCPFCGWIEAVRLP